MKVLADRAVPSLKPGGGDTFLVFFFLFSFRYGLQLFILVLQLLRSLPLPAHGFLLCGPVTLPMRTLVEVLISSKLPVPATAPIP